MGVRRKLFGKAVIFSAMFERLGEIYTNKEVYLTDLDHDEVPALFWWFPNQDDFVAPPPAHETAVEKMERISSTIKQNRSEITEIMYSGLSPEERIIRALEIQQEAEILNNIFKVNQTDQFLVHKFISRNVKKIQIVKKEKQQRCFQSAKMDWLTTQQI